MSFSFNDLTLRTDLSGHAAGTGPVRTQKPRYADFMPPCNHACPAGENVQAWLALAQAGDYRKAWEELTEENPMPAIHSGVTVSCMPRSSPVAANTMSMAGRPHIEMPR